MNVPDSQDRSYLEHPGFQVIRPLLEDSSVTEVMINGPDQVFVERAGRMEQTTLRFESSEQLRFLVESITRPTGRTVDAQRPFVDCRLPDGSRVNIVMPPVSLAGTSVTIRKFTRSLRSVADLVQVGTLPERMARVLSAAIRGRANILFCGATGSGKTTALGIFSTVMSESERIVIIEDTAELDLSQAHVVRLECRQASVEGSGQVTLEDLLKNALRMRPTRIILGEIRGAEAVELLQAVHSGHDGCLAVLHASSPADAIARLELMTLSRGFHLPLWGVHRQIAGGIDLIVQLEQLLDGSRKITHLTEIVGFSEDRVELQDLFEFQHDAFGPNGEVRGHWECTGAVPTFLPRLEKHGVPVAPELFAKGPLLTG